MLIMNACNGGGGKLRMTITKVAYSSIIKTFIDICYKYIILKMISPAFSEE